MIKLNRAEISQLKNLMRDGSWDLITKIATHRIIAIQSEEIVGNNEFETLRMLHKNQGRAQELTNFFKELDEGAFQ